MEYAAHSSVHMLCLQVVAFLHALIHNHTGNCDSVHAHPGLKSKFNMFANKFNGLSKKHPEFYASQPAQ
jgi:hypothetical protein